MPLDLYCRLYVQCDLTKSELRDVFAASVGGQIAGFSVESSFLRARIRDNKDYDIERFNSERRFVFSRYTVEVEPLEETTINANVYIDHVCSLVSDLRKAGALVSVSCEYEDVILQKTGWNWREDCRDHPPIPS